MAGFWVFFWMFVVLKIPVLFALWLVWYAVHGQPAPEQGPSDGGGSDRNPHPRPARPRRPRRGPHADPPPLPPQRVRAVGRRLTRSGRG